MYAWAPLARYQTYCTPYTILTDNDVRYITRDASLLRSICFHALHLSTPFGMLTLRAGCKLIAHCHGRHHRIIVHSSLPLGKGIDHHSHKGILMHWDSICGAPSHAYEFQNNPSNRSKSAPFTIGDIASKLPVCPYVHAVTVSSPKHLGGQYSGRLEVALREHMVL